MNNSLSCDVVKDLLPIYFDGIASEETNICVKKHLSECKICLNEYKKLYETTEKKEKVIENEAALIRKLRKRIIYSFITVVIASILLITLELYSYNAESHFRNNFTIFDLLSGTVFYIGMYFLPLLGILVSVIWKKTLSKKDSTLWPDVFISFLGTCVLIKIIFLLWHFLAVT